MIYSLKPQSQSDYNQRRKQNELEDRWASAPVVCALAFPVAAGVFVNNFPGQLVFLFGEPGRRDVLVESSPFTLHLLKPHFLLVGLVPSAILHEPLIRSVTRIGRCTIFHLVELRGKDGEVVIKIGITWRRTLSPDHFRAHFRFASLPVRGSWQCFDHLVPLPINVYLHLPYWIQYGAFNLSLIFREERMSLVT